MASESHHGSEVQHEAGQKQGLPQLNPDSFASQLFWLALVFGFLYVILSRSILPRIRGVLGERQSQLQQDLDAAEGAKLAAETARASYEAELAAAKQQSAELMLTTQRQMEAKYAEQQAALQLKIDSIMTDSKQRLDQQQEAAKKEIAPLIEELTSLAAQPFLGKAPTKTQLEKAMKVSGTQ